MDHLLESMKKTKDFYKYDIIIVVGGCDVIIYETEKIENITYIKCNYSSYDYTSLIALSELYSDNLNDYYFMLHDTCKVGDLFYEKLNKIDLTNVSTIKINQNWSMNIGIYSQKIINQNKEKLLSMKNIDKTNAVVEEDFIFKNDINNITLDSYNLCIFEGPIDYYNSGTMRIVEYYSNIDLYKIKSNWTWGNFTSNL